MDFIVTNLPVAIIFLVAIIVVLKSGIKFIPHNTAYVVERFGKFQSTKPAGLNFIIPFIDRVSAKRTLKEQAVDVPSQSGITKDNISLSVDGVLYFRVLDPYKATYGVDKNVFAVTQLAQTTMRSELGKMELDKTFEERDQLNANIVNAINDAAAPWGIQVMRYEMKAERVKRAQILESEGDRQSAINVAEGQKQSVVLAAEADKSEQILRAEGEAQAILAVAEAQAEALRKVGEVANTKEGQKAVQLDLGTKAIAAKAAIAKESSVVLLPDSGTEAATIVAQAMSIIQTLNKKNSGGEDSDGVA